MVLLPSGGRRLVLWLDIFQMARPGELDEYGHGYSGEERITGLVSEADRQKAENERRSFFPIPEILVEQVNCANQQEQQKVLCLSHVIDGFVVYSGRATFPAPLEKANKWVLD